MISKTASPEYINQYIINTLETIIKKRRGTTLNTINRRFYDYLLGEVTFKKEAKNDYINVNLKNCKFGYDFYNKEYTQDEEDECCVCYEKTKQSIECGHIICDDCIKKIMDHSKTIACPMCRKNHETNKGLQIKYPMHLVTLLFNLE